MSERPTAKYPAIRVSPAAKKYLHERSQETGASISEYVDRLVKEDARRLWFEKAKDFYANDAEALAEQKAEAAALEKALPKI